METTYYSLASKNNFNKALRHFFAVNDLVDELDSKRNIADVLNVWGDSHELSEEQILPMVGSVIRDKYSYSYKSCNLTSTVTDFTKIATETAKWTAVDLAAVYVNLEGKIFIINPKNNEHWSRVGELTKDQLLVVYSKYRKGDDKKIETEAIDAVIEMLFGKDVFINKEFIDAGAAAAPPPPASAPQVASQPKQAAASASPAQPQSGGAHKVTPKYAVAVSNELFHNGNVEAWKKIIESYNTKYPDLKVHIFHQGEVIHDINSLFKWGKVKHGDSIFFQVSGEDIRGVSKLQKYLYEGASQRFEQFLKIGVGKVLNLF